MSSYATCPLKNSIQRYVDAFPFVQQLLENLLADRRQAIEALVALIFFAPLTYQQALGFQAAQERVERTFVDSQAVVGQGLAQGVAILFGSEWSQDCNDQAPAAELQLQVLEQVSVVVGTVRHIVCGIHYMSHSTLSTKILPQDNPLSLLGLFDSRGMPNESQLCLE